MAATKYQVLYRYINEATNAAITNSMMNDYEPVCELYADANPGHKIFSDDLMAQAEAMNEQQEIISFGNNTDNPKNNMLFAYNGTKKIKHKNWVVETTGYIVRDWKQLKRSSIGNQGDFTKEFTTIGAATPEDGGTVICTEKVRDKYFPENKIVIAKDNSLADAGTPTNRYYTEEKINKMITESTLFALVSDNYIDYGEPSKTAILRNYYGDKIGEYYTGPVAIGKNNMKEHSSGNYSVYGAENKDGLYVFIDVDREQIKTTTFPGHYEEALNAPYLIKDTYKKIQLSPWFVNCTCGSLESALEKAKTLVDMIGIDNVKLIKIVPFDQFVKIK